MQDDDDDLPGGFGALGGGAAESLDRVVTKVVPTGLQSTISCWNCGQKNLIALDWNEIIIGSVQLVPPNWDVDKKTGTLYPHVGCSFGGCHRPIKIGFTPQELNRAVLAGIEQGFITKDFANGTAAQMLQAAGRSPRR
ncbi:MAG: hypothetical protein V4567_05340 [Pseudomonadota bacterium]